MLSQTYHNITSVMKNIIGCFTEKGHSNVEYHIKLSGYYFCKNRNSTILVFQIRNKRIIYKTTVEKATQDKTLINSLHPMDACIIGVIANKERNGLIDRAPCGWQNMKTFNQHNCFIKSPPLLKVSQKNFNSKSGGTTCLFSPQLGIEIIISTLELSVNEALLYALEPLQAMSIGYDAGESYLRKSQ